MVIPYGEGAAVTDVDFYTYTTNRGWLYPFICPEKVYEHSSL